MNDDAKFGWCSAPQEHIPNSAFPRLVAVRFTVGSVVWAHLDGFPWWPALVDDDPDTEDFFWLDGFSETPTHYHVTFLDGPTQPVTRGWVTPARVRKFESGDQASARTKSRCRGIEYRARLEAAVEQAHLALACPLAERRRRFTFVARYPGPWPVYSDSEAETARLPDGRRPSRKRSRDDETVNSLMDVVDDIVQQLTQSQSQSQSQSRHTQGDAGEGVLPLIDDAPGGSEAAAAAADESDAECSPEPDTARTGSASRAPDTTQPRQLKKVRAGWNETAKPKPAHKKLKDKNAICGKSKGSHTPVKQKKKRQTTAPAECQTGRILPTYKTKKAGKASEEAGAVNNTKPVFKPKNKSRAITAMRDAVNSQSPTATPEKKSQKPPVMDNRMDSAEPFFKPKTQSQEAPGVEIDADSTKSPRSQENELPTQLPAGGSSPRQDGGDRAPSPWGEPCARGDEPRSDEERPGLLHLDGLALDAESSSLFEPAPTPSPRAYTELQSEERSQELFGAAEQGYQSDPFEADD
ncbi:zinc finger CW-type PWWP domain protein 1-like [Pollicipes pollicipes]|uniref:zinc finger CW-type PWWP domain protein 1-like n=1 Tax=Pollicipes pollicipes TaxID=41117 RepID=UPI001884BA89|nr:zinc finger CW-type PWWP domain protein 1-like [Pollicipes pollicipes]